MPDLPFGPLPELPEAPKLKKGEASFDSGPLLEQVNATAGRLRMNEERYSELRKKVLLIEQNMLSGQKKSISDIKTINNELTELKHQIAQIQDRIMTLIKEIGLLAKKEDVDVLRKYLDFWEPVKFVTADFVDKAIEDKLKQLGIMQEEES